MKKSNSLISLLYEEIDCRSAKVTDFEVKPTTIQYVRDFVERWHYSSNVNGLRISQVFGLFYDGHLIGAMIYGPLGMANTWKKYGDSESDVVELRRLCCIDNTPKCTESYFIGKTLRWLKKNSDYKVIVSYADAHYNHTGIIYRATNFEYHGLTAKGRVIDFDGKLYHDKCIRTYNVDKNGIKKLKPFAQRVKDALKDGRAKYVNTPGKHIYVFRLKKVKKTEH
tara:strand:- start:749 stop:1420 length:672 start_codon:yes stop_codon:yes gene_type:complete